MSDNDENMAEQVAAPPAPEPGTRVRTIISRGICVANRQANLLTNRQAIRQANPPVNMNHKIYFDRFALIFTGFPNISVSLVACPSQGIQVCLEQCFPSFLVELDVKVLSTDGRELYQTEVLFDNTMENLHHLDTVSFSGQTVDFEIKFNRIEGLGIEPLRDYSVSSDLSDITLVVDGKKFFVNKGFLASHSSFFERMFYGEFAEKTMEEITLKEVSASAFTDLLDVLHQELHTMYNKDQLFACLKLADQWDVKSVVSKVQTTFQLYPELLNLNVGEKLWLFDRFRMTVFLHQSLGDWQKSYSKYVTEDMFNELSDATKFAIFKKFA